MQDSITKADQEKIEAENVEIRLAERKKDHDMRKEEEERMAERRRRMAEKRKKASKCCVC
mgnify:FL=1